MQIADTGSASQFTLRPALCRPPSRCGDPRPPPPPPPPPRRGRRGGHGRRAPAVQLGSAPRYGCPPPPSMAGASFLTGSSAPSCFPRGAPPYRQCCRRGGHRRRAVGVAVGERPSAVPSASGPVCSGNLLVVKGGKNGKIEHSGRSEAAGNCLLDSNHPQIVNSNSRSMLY